MRSQLFLLAVFLLPSTAISAQATLDGNWMLKHCGNFVRKDFSEPASDIPAAACAYYLRGFTGAMDTEYDTALAIKRAPEGYLGISSFVCLPEGRSSQQIIRVVVKYDGSPRRPVASSR